MAVLLLCSYKMKDTAVFVRTHPLQAKIGLPAELLLRQPRVCVARGDVSAPPGSDLVRNLQKKQTFHKLSVFSFGFISY